MATKSMNSVVTSLRMLSLCHDGADATDGELLTSFLAEPAERTFEAIVRRHGPMVLGVCRRILGDEHDAEDAFQATFLVLVKKAADLRARTVVGDWLHGVACRTALKAKSASAQRRSKEKMAARSETTEAKPFDDLAALLDEELGKLPDKFRIPLVLCDMEGKTRDEAARELGWPAGTVAGRLARARARLAERLRSRGVLLPAALIAAALAQSTASACVSVALASSTVTAASLIAAGATANGVVSANVSALVQGVLDAMFWKKAINVVVLALAAIVVIAGATAYCIAKSDSPEARGNASPNGLQQPDPIARGDALPAEAIARLGDLRWRHGEPITYVAFSANGKVAVTGGETMVCVWDADSGKEMRRYFPAEGPARDRLTVAAGVNTSRAVHLRGHNRYALSSDGRFLAIAYSAGGKIETYDIDTGKIVQSILAPTDKLIAFALSPDGKRVALRTSGRVTILYDLESGKQLRGSIGPSSPGLGGMIAPIEATGIAFAPNSKAIATAEVGSKAGAAITQVRLTDVETMKEVQTFDFSLDAIYALALSPDGATIAVATDGGIDVLDRPNGGSVRKLKVPTRTTTLAFTRDADVLAAKGIDSVVRLFDYKSGKVLHTMGEPKPAAPPLSSILRYYPFVADDLAVTPDGKSLAVGGGAALRRYSIATGKEVSHAQAHHDAVTAFAIAPDGKHLFSRGNDALIRRWNLARGAEITRFAEPRDTTAMAFAPDGTRMAVGSADGTIRIFSTADAKELHQLNAHSAVPVRLAFSPDGKRLASRSAVDPWLRVFDVDKGIELRKFEWKKIESANTKKIRYVDAAGFGLAFAPDGLRIATFVQLEPQMMRKAPVAADSAPAIRIWDIATGIEMRRLVPSNDRIVDHLAFSPDGRLLTADNSDRTVGLWEVGSGQERLLLGTPARVDPSRSPLLGVGLDNRITEGAVRFYGDALGFSPNGKLLASAGVDHSVRVWDISKGTEITKYTGHRSHPTALRFNTDGKSLVSSSADSTLLVWHLADVKPAARQNLDLNAADLARRWKDLRDESAPKAWTAAMDLIGAPKATVAFLQRELTPAPAVDMKKLQQWVADLDSDVFAKRSVALVELANAGDVAAPALRKLLASEPSVETRRRVEPLLERILVGTYDKDQLRVVRAIEVLERIDSAEANAVLERLAKGAPSAVMTRQAQGALARKNVGRQP